MDIGFAGHVNSVYIASAHTYGQDQPASPEPATPPLGAIRAKGPRASGLNKPAILMAAGTGVATLLVLASGVLSCDPTRRPAPPKPMMSDPAWPEMAKGALRVLPVDYTQVAAPIEPPLEPAGPPALGTPLLGDIAAFAQPAAVLRLYGRPDDTGWDGPAPYGDVSAAVDPAAAEAELAVRSALFFPLRTPSAPPTRAIAGAGSRVSNNLTKIAATKTAAPGCEGAIALMRIEKRTAEEDKSWRCRSMKLDSLRGTSQRTPSGPAACHTPRQQAGQMTARDRSSPRLNFPLAAQGPSTVDSTARIAPRRDRRTFEQRPDANISARCGLARILRLRRTGRVAVTARAGRLIAFNTRRMAAAPSSSEVVGSISPQGEIREHEATQ